MTDKERETLLSVIDREIEETRIIYGGQSYQMERVGKGKIESLQWVRGLIEEMAAP